MSPYEDFKYTLTNLDDVGETNYLLEPIEYCLDKLKAFGEGDIRYDYFALVKDIIINYNLHIKNFWLRAFMDYEKDKDLGSLNKRLTEEFKRDAVFQLTSRGHPVPDVSERLGMSTKSLYDWIRQYSKPESERIEEASQASEIRCLKSELARVREERDILKKAAAYFSKESK